MGEGKERERERERERENILELLPFVLYFITLIYN